MIRLILKKAFLLLLLFSYFKNVNASNIIENKGQITQEEFDSQKILFYTAINGGTAYFLKDRIAFVLYQTTEKKLFNTLLTENKTNVFRYDYQFENAENFNIEAGQTASEKLTFYTRGKCYTANQYEKITYKNKSKGLSLVFYNHPEKGLKYDIVFENPKTNEVAFSFKLLGVTAKKILDETKKKQLLSIETPLGEIKEQFPSIYADVQKNNKVVRKEQVCNITIQDNTISYSTSVPLNCQSIVIDPWISFAGGADVDECYGVDGDSFGNVYISGYTQSIDFPSSAGAFQTNLNANYDAYIFKFDANGQRLWATYYGGSQNDFGYRLKVTPSGKPTLSGYTYSSDLYISASGVFSSSFSGSVDVFITQFDTNGNFLWGTFAGGTGGDFAVSMDMDKQGNIALGGFTSSSDFPTSPGAWQSVFGGALDCFVSKFDTTGNRVWSTFLGGMNSEDAHAIKFDTLGNVIVAGDTYSSNFPVEATSYQNFLMGGSDAFVTKFNNSGVKIWSTYLGGAGNEDIYALACDKANNIYFTGYSASSDFPISAGAFQSTMNGVRDLSIGSFSPTGNLRWLSYAGGTAWDTGRGIIVNSNQKLTVVGETNSLDFPMVGHEYDTINNGISDIVYMTLDSTGSVELSNLNGGASADYAYNICEVMQQKIVVSGNTYSTDFPVTSGVFQTIKSGDVDAFVWQIDTISIVTTIENSNINSNSYLYPNPSNDKVIIFGIPVGKYSVQLFNSQGQQLKQLNYESTGQIELSSLENLPNGIYTIRLTSNSSSSTYKLIKLN